MSPFKVCIVGAGAGGLSMARALARHGIDYDQFERHTDVGGVWDQANAGSAMYDSAHMISSKTMSAFMGFPMPAHYPDYPGHRQIHAYLRSFADAYGLREGISFGREVVSAVREWPKGWIVTLDDGSTRRYDALVAATGLAWEPRLPDYPGEFIGEFVHSSKYRSPEAFRGKRVLVIGAGNSGADISGELSRVASKAYLSMRRAYHFIPKHIFGMPADVFAVTGSILPMRIQQIALALVLRLLNGDVSRHGLQRPDHLPLTSHPIVNTIAMHAMAHGDLTPKVDVDRFEGKTVWFKDGSSIEVDAIIAATGYVHKISFIDDGLLANAGQESNLFLRSISRVDTTFAAIGFIEINGGVYPFYDQFADIIAAHYSDLATGSDRARSFESMVKSGRHDVAGAVTYVDSPRHKVYANVLAAMRVIRKIRREMGWKKLKAEDLAPAGVVLPKSPAALRAASETV